MMFLDNPIKLLDLIVNIFKWSAVIGGVLVFLDVAFPMFLSGIHLVHFLIGFLLLLAILILGILLEFHRSKDYVPERWAIPWSGILSGVIVLVFTIVAVVSNLPKKVVFEMHRTELERLEKISPRDLVTLKKQRLGIFEVKTVRSINESPMHFEVANTAKDNLDQLYKSYGYVRNPDFDEIPFNGLTYTVFPLSDGWYWYETDVVVLPEHSYPSMQLKN